MPLIISIFDLEISKNSDKNIINALFALPSTGGAFSAIHKTPSRSPLISVFLAFGVIIALNFTRTVKPIIQNFQEKGGRDDS